MKNGGDQKTKNAGPFLREGSRFSSARRGNVLLYVLLSVTLLAALTFAFTKGSRENTAVQLSNKAAQELYVQASLIRSAILECALTYPAGGPDTNADGSISTAENPNNPYPLNPSNATNLSGAAPDDSVLYSNGTQGLGCIGAPNAAASGIFYGNSSSGRFLPLPPGGFNRWMYKNDANGVYIQISSTTATDPTALNALALLRAKYATCQADLNYGGGCGANCFTAWIVRAACP